MLTPRLGPAKRQRVTCAKAKTSRKQQVGTRLSIRATKRNPRPGLARRVVSLVAERSLPSIVTTDGPKESMAVQGNGEEMLAQPSWGCDITNDPISAIGGFQDLPEMSLREDSVFTLPISDPFLTVSASPQAGLNTSPSTESFFQDQTSVPFDPVRLTSPPSSPSTPLSREMEPPMTIGSLNYSSTWALSTFCIFRSCRTHNTTVVAHSNETFPFQSSNNYDRSQRFGHKTLACASTRTGLPIVPWGKWDQTPLRVHLQLIRYI
jgi:hypothetical protein